MNLPQTIRLALHWCGSAVLLLLCWAAWLVLSALLALQIWTAFHRELALPDFALHAIERRLAASEVTASVGRAVFDPTGCIVLENVQLFAPGQSGPLVTIRAAYGRVDFWPLLAGDFRLHEVRVTGVDLRVPAMLSPSGMDEAAISDLDGIFHIQRRDYDIALCRFRIGGLAVTSRGGFHLPAAVRSRPGSLPLLDLVLQRYLDTGRKLVALRPRLAALEEPYLQLVLTPSPDRGAMVAAELSARAFREEGFLDVAAAHAQTVFPLLGDAPFATRVTVETEHLDWRTQAQVEWLRIDLGGSLVPDRFSFKPQVARLTAAGGTAMGFPFGTPVAELGLTQLPRLQGDVSVRAGGAPLAAHGDLDLKRGEGSLALSGLLTPALLRLAADRTNVALAKKIALSEPALVQARIELAPGWKPARAEAEVSARHLVAHDVPLDAASGHATFAGHDLRVTDIVAVQGDNAAYGSYAMDTVTRDYRFLLKGRMRPPDISGWFKPSWLRFWSNFDFSASPPDADVDVSGRWGSAQRSTVYCRVDAVRPEIRGVPFDRMRTTLFFRPNYYDVSAFLAERAGHSAHGSFIVTLDPELSTYRTLDFSGDSDLDLAECARLYGPAGTAMAAPFQFAEPPNVHLTGHFDGPGMPGGPHKRVTFTVTSHGRFALHDFPLDKVRFDGDYDDDNLDLRQIEAGFAGGTATGKARLDGRREVHTLAFDAKLSGADLARVITSLDEYQSAGKPPAPERTKGRILSRATGSHLDAVLAAEGRYGQPFSFHGDGHLLVTGKELGEIHLLGSLSELLSRTLLNFTSLRIETAQASFKLEGNKVRFPQVKLLGPSASIDAKGDYLLDARTLDFNARVYPLQESKLALPYGLGLLLAPLSSFLELKLTGPLAKPSWVFVYGPTNILRLLTQPSTGGAPYAPSGGAAPPPAPPSALPPSSADQAPPSEKSLPRNPG
jgi:hypothetical protein